jgi:hypothetical protein
MRQYAEATDGIIRRSPRTLDVTLELYKASAAPKPTPAPGKARP